MDITYFNSFLGHCHSFGVNKRKDNGNCVELVMSLHKIVFVSSLKEPLIADLIGAACEDQLSLSLQKANGMDEHSRLSPSEIKYATKLHYASHMSTLR